MQPLRKSNMYTVRLQSFRTDFFQRILSVLSNSHCWNWVLSCLSFFHALLCESEQSSFEVSCTVKVYCHGVK